MIKAVIQKEHFVTAITNDAHRIFADEPLEKGGTNKGFSPMELLAASLASCVAITLRMYADRKQWSLQEVRVSINLENETGTIKKEIELVGDLSPDQIERLTEISASCPVSKILSQSNNLETYVTWTKI
jgi:putative redox protein